MDRFASMTVFVRVVEAGSFSAAARHLNVRQPAVTKTIARLEAWLGVRLLVRSTHGLAATEAGRRFYLSAKRAIEEAVNAEEVARITHATLAGNLRVSASVAFAKLYIVPRMPALLEANPGLSVDLILDEGTVDLVAEGLDLRIASGPLPSSSLIARPLGRSRCVVVATREYLERRGVPESPMALSTHEIILSVPDLGSETLCFRQNGSQIAVNITTRVRMSGSEGVRTAILCHMGIGMVPEWLFAAELTEGSVRTVLEEWTLPYCDVAALIPAGRTANAKVREFIRFLDADLQLSGAFRPSLAPRAIAPTEPRPAEIAPSQNWAAPPSTVSSIPVT